MHARLLPLARVFHFVRLDYFGDSGGQLGLLPEFHQALGLRGAVWLNIGLPDSGFMKVLSRWVYIHQHTRQALAELSAAAKLQRIPLANGLAEAESSSSQRSAASTDAPVSSASVESLQPPACQPCRLTRSYRVFHLPARNFIGSGCLGT